MQTSVRTLKSVMLCLYVLLCLVVTKRKVNMEEINLCAKKIIKKNRIAPTYQNIFALSYQFKKTTRIMDILVLCVKTQVLVCITIYL